MKVKARLLCRNGQKIGSIQIIAYYKDQQKEIALGRKLDKIYWDPNKGVAKGREHQLLNIQIRNVIREISDLIDEYIVLKKDVDLTEIFDKVFNIKKIVAPAPDRPLTLVQFITDFIAENPEKINQSSMNSYRTLLTSITAFDISDTDLKDVNVRYVNMYYDYLVKSGLKASTIRTRFMKLKKVINTAVVRGYCNEYPFGRGKLTVPNPKVSKRKFLQEDEIKLLLGYIPKNVIESNVIQIVKFNLHVGLRIGDIFTLQKKHIIAEDHPEAGRKFKLSRTTAKTGADINILLTRQASEQIILNGYDRKKDNDFIFPWIKHKEFHDEYSLYRVIASRTAYFNRILAEICAELGIQKVSSHSLRHTFCTTLLSKGVPVTSISKLVGHADISTTMIYAQILQKTADDAIQVLED